MWDASIQKFRSTGSYEPDLISFRVILTENCFDPQALTSLTNATNTGENIFFVSIHRLLRAWPNGVNYGIREYLVSIHRLLRAWPKNATSMFLVRTSFDPQALTSLTGETIPVWPKRSRFDPQALTSLTGRAERSRTGGAVSIHRLLRAWPILLFYKHSSYPMFRSTGSYEPDPDC